jgi:hypothetical protein
MSHAFKNYVGGIFEQSALDRHEAIADNPAVATKVSVTYSGGQGSKRAFLSQVDSRSGN